MINLIGTDEEKAREILFGVKTDYSGRLHGIDVATINYKSRPCAIDVRPSRNAIASLPDQLGT